MASSYLRGMSTHPRTPHRASLTKASETCAFNGFTASILCLEVVGAGPQRPYLAIPWSPFTVLLTHDWPFNTAHDKPPVERNEHALKDEANTLSVHIVTRERILLRD
jgi:hypothetical protein